MDGGKTQSYRLWLNGCKVLVQNNLRTSSLAEWCVFLCLRSFLDKQMMHIHHIFCLWIDKKKKGQKLTNFQRSHGSDFKVQKALICWKSIYKWTLSKYRRTQHSKPFSFSKHYKVYIWHIRKPIPVCWNILVPCTQEKCPHELNICSTHI